jgi:hypothetical protein
MPPPVGLTVIFDAAPTMLTGYYRIRDPAAFIDHGSFSCERHCVFRVSCDCFDMLGRLVVLPVSVGSTSVLDFYQGVLGLAVSL